MKKFILFVIGIAVTCSANAFVPAPYTESLGFSFTEISSGYTHTGNVTVYDEQATAPSIGAAYPYGESVLGIALLKPGKVYNVSFQGSTFVMPYGGSSGSLSLSYNIRFSVPSGYDLYINGERRENYSGGASGGAQTLSTSAIFSVQLRSIADDAMVDAGVFSGIRIGKAIVWNVGLGGLRSGRTAGLINFREKDLADSPASRERLFYVPPPNDNQITVVNDGPSNQRLRQISVPQVVVDFVDDSSGGYWMKFYSPSQATWTGSIYTFTGQTPWRTIHAESSESNRLKITESEGARSRESIINLQSGSVSSGSFVWLLKEGSGDNIRYTKQSSVYNAATAISPENREVLEEIYGNDSINVAVSKYVYLTQPWGTEALWKSVRDPSGAALTTTFIYHTDPAKQGNYTRVKSVKEATGSWVSYSYYDDWNRRGRLRVETRPYLDSDVVVQDASTGVGYSASYDFGPDYTGLSRNEIIREIWINGRKVGKRLTTANLGSVSTTYTIRDYLSESDSLESSSEVLYPFKNEIFLSNRPLWVVRPDKTMDLYKYSAKGVYLDAGVVLGGTDTYGIEFNRGTSISSAEANTGTFYPMPKMGTTNKNIYFVNGKGKGGSYYLNLAGLIFIEYTGGLCTNEQGVSSSKTLETINYKYDFAGRLLEKKSDNGALLENVYTDGQLTSTVGSDGTSISYGYDELGRLERITKAGVSASGDFAAQPDITTLYTYDAADRIVGTDVFDGTSPADSTIKLSETANYDLAGRLKSQTAYAGSDREIKTEYSYSQGGRIVTKTLPHTGKQVVESYLDGRLKSVTGSAVVAEYYSYLVDATTGNQKIVHRVGSETSEAETSTILDWLGRTVSVTQPSFSGGSITRNYHYNSYGQLYKVSQPSVADTLYLYGADGKMYTEGLDLNGDGAIQYADDSWTYSSSFYFVNQSGSAFLRSQVYRNGREGSVDWRILGDKMERLTGFTGNLRAETLAWDQYGNPSSIKTEIDRNAKTVTSTATIVGSNNAIVQVAYNGLLMTAKDSAGLTTKYGYDKLGRRINITDPRTGTSSTSYYPSTSLIKSVVDAATVTQAEYDYDSSGRPILVTDAFQKKSRCDYNLRGQKVHEWGDTSYPVEYVYDSYGRMTKLKTYASGTPLSGASETWSSPGVPAYTFWDYDVATGLLKYKYDAANLDANGDPITDAKRVSYDYTNGGQLYTRTNQRGTIATYEYYPKTAELKKITYSDGTTPSVDFTYTRIGQLKTVSDYTGTRTFIYENTGVYQGKGLDLVSVDYPSFYNSRRLTLNFDRDFVTGGRYRGYSLGTSTAPAENLSVAYGFQTDGRLGTLTADSQVFTYGYVTNSNLIERLTAGSYTDVRNYDPKHDWTQSRTTSWGTDVQSSFVYERDIIGQVLNTTKTGALYNLYGNGTEGLKTSYSYDALSQLKSEQTMLGATRKVLPGRDNGTAENPGYSYDNLGNRKSVTHNNATTGYGVNALNQYNSITTPGLFDIAGAATAYTDVGIKATNGSTITAARSGNYFHTGLALNNSAGPVYKSLSITADSSTSNLLAYLPQKDLEPRYDDDGNMTFDGRWELRYDAENRLISCETSEAALAAGAPKKRLEFAYDYANRRVQKKVFKWTESSTEWTCITDLRFLYDGWNLIAEYSVKPRLETPSAADFTLLRSYTWGLDLSGTNGGAGGVGGLIRVQDASGSYIPAYDAMGNVHGLLDASGNLVAAYEYDAFGQILRASGPYAANNPFRFSSKYTDAETGFVYYGMRFYSPNLGRFVNRDPIEEMGGLNLYGFCGNNGVNQYDYLGMSWLSRVGRAISDGWHDFMGFFQEGAREGNDLIDKGRAWVKDKWNTNVQGDAGASYGTGGWRPTDGRGNPVVQVPNNGKGGSDSSKGGSVNVYPPLINRYGGDPYHRYGSIVDTTDYSFLVGPANSGRGSNYTYEATYSDPYMDWWRKVGVAVHEQWGGTKVADAVPSGGSARRSVLSSVLDVLKDIAGGVGTGGIDTPPAYVDRDPYHDLEQPGNRLGIMASSVGAVVGGPRGLIGPVESVNLGTVNFVAQNGIGQIFSPKVIQTGSSILLEDFAVGTELGLSGSGARGAVELITPLRQLVQFAKARGATTITITGKYVTAEGAALGGGRVGESFSFTFAASDEGVAQLIQQLRK